MLKVSLEIERRADLARDALIEHAHHDADLGILALGVDRDLEVVRSSLVAQTTAFAR